MFLSNLAFPSGVNWASAVSTSSFCGAGACPNKYACNSFAPPGTLLYVWNGLTRFHLPERSWRSKDPGLSFTLGDFSLGVVCAIRIDVKKMTTNRKHCRIIVGPELFFSCCRRSPRAHCELLAVNDKFLGQARGGTWNSMRIAGDCNCVSCFDRVSGPTDIHLLHHQRSRREFRTPVLDVPVSVLDVEV